MKKIYFLNEDALSRRYNALMKAGKYDEADRLRNSSTESKKRLDAHEKGQFAGTMISTGAKRYGEEVIKSGKKDAQVAKTLRTKSLERNRNDYNSDAFKQYMERYKANAAKRGKAYDETEMMKRAKASYASSQVHKRNKEKAAAEKLQANTQTANGQRINSAQWSDPTAKAKKNVPMTNKQWGALDNNANFKANVNPTKEAQAATKKRITAERIAQGKDLPSSMIRECVDTIIECSAEFGLNEDYDFVLETALDLLSEDEVYLTESMLFELLEACDFEGTSENITVLKEMYNINENFNDYMLYTILDESGYTPTEANLSILKEGLESGKYIIE